MINEVEKFLQESKANYTITPFNKAIYTVPGVAEAIGIEEGQVVKTMIIKNKQRKFWGVILPGDKKLDFKWVENLLEQKKLVLASPSEVKELLGYEVGAVSPITLIIKDIKTVFDKELLKYDVVNVASSDHTFGFDINASHLHELIKPVLAL